MGFIPRDRYGSRIGLAGYPEADTKHPLTCLNFLFLLIIPLYRTLQTSQKCSKISEQFSTHWKVATQHTEEDGGMKAQSTLSIAARHLPPNSARTSYTTDGHSLSLCSCQRPLKGLGPNNYDRKKQVSKHACKQEVHPPQVEKVPSRVK